MRVRIRETSTASRMIDIVTAVPIVRKIVGAIYRKEVVKS
jgi:hypothetical protein